MWFIYIQIGMAVGFALVSLLYYYVFNAFSGNLSYKIRIKYFERCLEMDAAFYDDKDATQMPSKIANECAKIKNGLGIKVGQLFMSVGQLVSGFIIAFWQGWHFTLILFGFMPVIIIAFALFLMGIIGGVQEVQKSYVQSAGYAE